MELISTIQVKDILFIFIGVLSCLITMYSVNILEYKNSYLLNIYDYMLAIIFSIIIILIFPIHLNGDWYWFIITGIATGMIVLHMLNRRITPRK